MSMWKWQSEEDGEWTTAKQKGNGRIVEYSLSSLCERWSLRKLCIFFFLFYLIWSVQPVFCMIHENRSSDGICHSVFCRLECLWCLSDVSFRFSVLSLASLIWFTLNAFTLRICIKIVRQQSVTFIWRSRTDLNDERSFLQWMPMT